MCDDESTSTLGRYRGSTRWLIGSSLCGLQVSLNQQDRNGYTMLHHACSHGREKTAEWLLANGASPFIKGDDGLTASQVALQSDHGELWQRLSNLGLLQSHVHGPN